MHRTKFSDRTNHAKHDLASATGHAGALSTIRVVIANSYWLYASGLQGLLNKEADIRVVGTAATLLDAATLVRTFRANVLLLDPRMPDGCGIQALPQFTAFPGLHVLIVTSGLDEDERAAAFRLGARAVVPKDAQPRQLCDGLRALVRGDVWDWQHPAPVPLGVSVPIRIPTLKASRTLTPREWQVLDAIGDGCANREIALRLGIAEDTVKHHLTSLFDKTGTSTRVELALRAVHHRLLDT